MIKCYVSKPFLFAFACMAFASWQAQAHPEGPPPAHTGVLGEPDCSLCHFAGPEPTERSGLTVTGHPERVSPGAVYELKVLLIDSEHRAGGFQLAVLKAGSEGKDNANEEAQAAASAGEFITADQQRIDTQSNRTYLGHSEPKHSTKNEATQYMHTEWLIRWQAPDDYTGPFRIIAAAVASDYDDSPLGDTVYLYESEPFSAEQRP